MQNPNPACATPTGLDFNQGRGLAHLCMCVFSKQPCSTVGCVEVLLSSFEVIAVLPTHKPSTAASVFCVPTYTHYSAFMSSYTTAGRSAAIFQPPDLSAALKISLAVFVGCYSLQHCRLTWPYVDRYPLSHLNRRRAWQRSRVVKQR